jgi:hypothetical protein
MVGFSLAMLSMFFGYYSNFWTGSAAGLLWSVVSFATAGVCALIVAGFFRMV